jgi:hypothetical protein
VKLWPWYGNGVRLGACGVGGCDRAFLNSLWVLLVPAYAQVCFVETDRRIMVRHRDFPQHLL